MDDQELVTPSELRKITSVGFRNRIHVGGQPYTSLNLERDKGFSLTMDIDRGLMFVFRIAGDFSYEAIVPFANIDYMNPAKVSHKTLSDRTRSDATAA
jgi:hypothetical protein